MAKLPFFQFYPLDWLRDTSILSNQAAGAWINILCYAWNEPERGVYVRPRDAFCRELRINPADLIPLLSELAHVASVVASDQKISITSRRMVKEERAREANRNAQSRLRERGGGDPLKWLAIRVHILERDKYICGYCGRKAATVDHITPKSRGGNHEYSNLIACCKRCNLTKGNRTPEEANLSFFNPASYQRHTDVIPKSGLRSQKLEVRERKEEEEEKKASPLIPAPASPKGPMPDFADPLIQKQLEAQNYEAQVRARIRSRLKPTPTNSATAEEIPL